MNRYERTQPDLVIANGGEAVAPQPGWGVQKNVVIFVRRDGLRLGASAELSRRAFEGWADPDEWTHVIFITPDGDEVKMTIRQFLRLVGASAASTRVKFIDWIGGQGFLQN